MALSLVKEHIFFQLRSELQYILTTKPEVNNNVEYHVFKPWTVIKPVFPKQKAQEDSAIRADPFFCSLFCQ